MAIRILDLRQFDRGSRRFRDVVYRNSSAPPGRSTPDGRGGFSVFDAVCACRGLNGDCLCRHIDRFYPHVGPEPCAYWAFDPEIFNPPNKNPHHLKAAALIPDQSDTQDVCHRNMHHVSDNRLTKAFKRPETEANLRLCVGAQSLPFSADRAIELVNERYPDPE